MVSDQRKIEQRLSVLQGLEWSGVSRAADMLTLGFGPKHEEKNYYGVPKQVSAWALHIQCAWRLSEMGKSVATEESIAGSDEEANAFIMSLRQVLAQHVPVIVEGISANSECGLVVSLSQGFRLIVATNGTADDEDWRFFESKRDARHLVIEGGRIALQSFN
ncbi:hypothetical protein AWB75_07058 [Caballeronia catudaia]|uniref:Uncharacterized protein n=1 Tax=Caballeronia catudaia TaxID=1777136 RepID=A0A158DRS7_9BURK|nr:hypothetical protein [Caballeronia catudaia]SAK96886.1 hypothetical protein AWB75_07058 [Caballeronia catudaia]